MPNLDSSDYIRKVKLRAKVNADIAADPRKFRALTQHVTYDPYRVIEKNISFDDGFLENKHYVFKAPCCFVSRAPSTLETIILGNNFCNTDLLIRVVEGTTYLITNNSGTTTFTISGSPTVYEIPEGESEFTALTSGNLLCGDGQPVETITLPSNYCSNAQTSVVEGITYLITNNSATTSFTIVDELNYPIVSIPSGTSVFTAPASGTLECNVF